MRGRARNQDHSNDGNGTMRLITIAFTTILLVCSMLGRRPSLCLPQRPGLRGGQ